MGEERAEQGEYHMKIYNHKNYNINMVINLMFNNFIK